MLTECGLCTNFSFVVADTDSVMCCRHHHNNAIITMLHLAIGSSYATVNEWTQIRNCYSLCICLKVHVSFNNVCPLFFMVNSNLICGIQ